jgi:cell fate regulator YaaT (PSP1 superfamily)
MSNEEKKPAAFSKNRFNHKRRRTFAPPKGIVPTVAAEAVSEEKPAVAAEKAAPAEKRERPASNGERPFNKHHPKKNRHHHNNRKPRDQKDVAEGLNERLEEAPLPEEQKASSSECSGLCETCPGCHASVELPTQEHSAYQEPSLPATEEPARPVKLVSIVGIRFKEAGKIYYFAPDKFNLQKDQSVIVETSRGIECGKIAIPNKDVSEDSLTSPLKKILRIATADDLQKVAKLREQEAQAKLVWEQKLANHNLEMTLVDVEYTFDAQKLIFYFTAEGRVDFRDFVKDLATVFKTRIELRQIGVRDEAKQLGGLGVCGRPFCCKTFLDDFQQVSIKMAKEQNLSLNSVKISGTCGRLMCCLRYENDVYEEEAKKTPRVDHIVMTPEGKGVVVENNVLKGTCKVRLDAKGDLAPMEFHRDQLKVLGKANKTHGKNLDESNEEEICD